MSTRNIYVARPSSSHHTLSYRRLTSPSLRLEKDLALSLREWQDLSFILERPGVSRVDYRLCEREQRISDKIRLTVGNFSGIVAFERADSQLSNGMFASSVGPKLDESEPLELVLVETSTSRSFSGI